MLFFLPKPARVRVRPAAALLAAAVTTLLAGASVAQPASAARSSPVLGAGTGLAPAAPVTLAARAAEATQGLAPGQIHAAYGLPARGARGQTIAVISAYDDPYAQADLNAYDKRFALPPCTRQNRCLRKLNENGRSSPLPSTDPSGGTWITESALGIEVAHGVCQSCAILLFEASTATKPDFSQAVNAAAAAGATVIVTMFTPPEDIGDSMYASDYAHPRAAVVAAAGDSIFGNWGYTGAVNFPSSLPNVLAVGGTDLRIGKAGGYGGERVWEGTVSGCSLYQPGPSWQAAAAAAVDCSSRRAVADVSAMADPGAVVRITGAGIPGGPWYTANGTSVAAPIIAGVIGLAGSAGSREDQMLYERARTEPRAFHDITTGANAPVCLNPICKAARGYDGPTGLGTPFGLAAFLPSGGAIAPGRPQVTISAPGNRLQPGPRWFLHLHVNNGNPFALTGQLVVRRTLRVGRQLVLVRFATAALNIGPLGDVIESVAIVHPARGLLKRLGSLIAYVELRVRGPAGRTVTVTRKLKLYAPHQ